MRVTGFITALLFLWLTSIQGQQTPVPPAQNGATQPIPATADDQSQVPIVGQPEIIDPKTGLPVLPADQRDKEIDKVDPLNPKADPAGQDSHPRTDREQPTAPPTNSNQRTEPLPGSVAASDANSAASRSTGDLRDNPSANPGDPQASATASDGQEYSGPAVLSRSYTLARPALHNQTVRWKASIGIEQAWDFGQTPADANVTDPTALASTTDSTALTWGLTGKHQWKHDQLALSYAGSYARYSISSLTGGNNTLSVDYAHVLSRRLTFQLREDLMRLSQNYWLQNPVVDPNNSAANTNTSTSPNVQVLDTQVRQSSTTASVTFNKSARLSYDASVGYFLIGREANGLNDTAGSQASGDVNYRLSRRTTVGAYYSYTDYVYSHHVQETDAHTIGFLYSYSLSRGTQFRTRLGITRLESLGYASVPLPPELAIFLGQSSVVVDTYSLRWISDISGELVHDFRRSRSLSFAFARGLSPGNGVQLASIQQTVTANYSMRYKGESVNAGVSYQSLSATAQADLGHYTTQTAYVGTSRNLRRGLATNLRVDYRHYNITGSPLLQHDVRVTLGITWNPPENSLRFW
jgi:hypothetical protein